jgi:large subunit ribosomal protein L4
MSDITLKTRDGKDAGSLQLDATVFGVQPNVPVMHQVVTAQLAARRAGTQSTKTRAEVRGGGKKPFKQKGTGNARQGSTRSPHFSGGGVALGPKPRKYGQKTPKKMVKLALRSALSDRAAEGKVIVVDSWGFDAPKTKDAVAALSALGVQGKALVVVDVNDTNTIRSFLNLPQVQLIEVNELNAYDVLCSDWVVFSKSTLPGEAVVTDVVTDVETEAAPKKAAAKKAAPKAAPAAEATPEAEAAPTLPAGAKAPKADGGAPKGYEIKGNADSGLYHVPGSAFYDRTVAELYFATAEDAEAAGFQLPPSQRDADSAEETN